MKILHSAFTIFSVVLLTACSNDPKEDIKEPITQPEYKEIPTLKTLVDQANVKGSVVVFNSESNTYYSNNFHWARSGFLPASTFKIPNSIIALENRVIENDTTIIKWDGEPKRFKVWEQDLTFRNALHYSCVPCYQEIARTVGLQNMQTYLSKLKFGKMDVDSANLDMFWLEGESKITAFEQIDFLNRFHNRELPISERTQSIMEKMLIITENDSIVLRGKTGWSNDKNINNGWFVGYIEKNNNIYYFATNIEPREGVTLKTFAELRRSLTYKALNIIYKL